MKLSEIKRERRGHISRSFCSLLHAKRMCRIWIIRQTVKWKSFFYNNVSFSERISDFMSTASSRSFWNTTHISLERAWSAVCKSKIKTKKYCFLIELLTEMWGHVVPSVYFYLGILSRVSFRTTRFCVNCVVRPPSCFYSMRYLESWQFFLFC